MRSCKTKRGETDSLSPSSCGERSFFFSSRRRHTRFDCDWSSDVCSSDLDEIVVVDPSGKGIAKLGDFDGIAPDGSPRGLLFPASPVFFGEFVYVTNLALDLRDFNPQFSAVDSQWTAEVTTWNVARISRHLPPVHDREGILLRRDDLPSPANVADPRIRGNSRTPEGPQSARHLAPPPSPPS